MPQSHASEQPMALLVLEQGATSRDLGHAQRWADRFRGTGFQVRLLEQGDESPSAFALRVRAAVAELEAEGRELGRAALVSGGRTDSDTLAARSLIIRAAASAMARRSEGEVLLDHRDEDRFGMQALADTVAIMVRGTGVDVRCAPLPASPMPVSIPAAPAPQPALARVA